MGGALSWGPHGRLGGMQACQRHDGHQMCGGFTMDENTLETFFLGQTAGHSFMNDITLSEDGDSFVAMEVGDNYPRGIQTTSFTSKEAKKGL
jgi:hypothetical protein